LRINYSFDYVIHNSHGTNTCIKGKDKGVQASWPALKCNGTSTSTAGTKIQKEGDEKEATPISKTTKQSSTPPHPSPSPFCDHTRSSLPLSPQISNFETGGTWVYPNPVSMEMCDAVRG
jgi:hypothetical protein